jgi:EAL domain-containing protein (putative c-di-GMP-specific phosphodiesterase class I)
MSRADVACYTAKQQGRGLVVVYSAEDSDTSRRHMELQMAASLRESLEADRFELYVQEIRALAEGDAGHFEVLLRLRGRDGDVISPAAFIPAAERYQMMPHIDRWVLRQLLQVRGEELAALTGLNLAINLSATTLDDPGFPDYLAGLLQDTPLAAERLTFEITETTVVNQMGSVSEVLIWLREQGCKVALDDFGSGFSSFNYLKHFKVDYLKIDGSFVRNLMRSSVDHTIVESINEVAHRLNIKTVAEFVEEMALIPLLKDTGVDYVQGYAIGRPEPLDTLFKRHLGAALGAHPPLH